MEDILFDTPVWLLAVLGLAGLVFLWAGFLRERRDKLLGGIGVILLVSGAVLFAASRIVETDKEQVVRRSRELVKSVEAKDWSALSDHLLPSATVIVEGTPMCNSRDEILEKARIYGNMAGSMELQITRNEPRPGGSGSYLSEVAVYVKADRGTQLVVTEVTWKKEAGVWSAQTINVKQLGLKPGAK
jgi:hypothetical protein